MRFTSASWLVLVPIVTFTACGGDSGGATGGGGSGATGTGTGMVGGGGEGGGMGGAGGTGGTGGTGGMGGTIEPGPDAVLETIGDPDKVLLRGWVVTPDQSFAGDVLIVGDAIACVAADCSGAPDAASASVVTTNGIILPGMIDSHNHILFDIFDESDWTPSEAYDHHDQWTNPSNEPRYSALVDAKQYLNGEGHPDPDVNCEMNKYGELKGLIAGTTSIAGAANPANKVCYRTLTRTVDQSANGLCGTDPPQSCPDLIQVNTLFPSTSSADAVCQNFADMDTESYVIHIGEGINQSARDELEDLRTVTTQEGCLHDPRTTIVHGTAFTGAEFQVMANAGMTLSWSPRSNVFLYGAGTDLTKTTDVPLALSMGITVALSPDWSLGGSENLLAEMRFAELVDAAQWGDQLTPQDIVEMTTIRAAEVLALDGQLGQLEVGYKADVVVVGGDPALPYASIIAATPREVRMVYIDGRLHYGDDQLEPIAPQTPGCESIDICGRAKFICVAREGGTASNLWGQTLAEIQANLESAIVAYDAMDLSPWDFAPIAPLTTCSP